MAQTTLDFTFSSLGALCGGAAAAVVVHRSPSLHDLRREWRAATTLYLVALLVAASVALHWTSVIAGNDGFSRVAFVAVSLLLLNSAVLGAVKRTQILLRCRCTDKFISTFFLYAALAVDGIAFLMGASTMIVRIVAGNEAGEVVTTAAFALTLVTEMLTRAVQFKVGLFTQRLRSNVAFTVLELAITLSTLILHTLSLVANPFAWLLYVNISVQALAIALATNSSADNSENPVSRRQSKESFVSGEQEATLMPYLLSEKWPQNSADLESVQNKGKFGDEHGMFEQTIRYSAAQHPPPTARSCDSISYVSTHMSREFRPNTIHFTASVGARATIQQRQMGHPEEPAKEEVQEPHKEFISSPRPMPKFAQGSVGQGERRTVRWSEQSRYSRVSTFFEPEPVHLPPPIYLTQHKSPQAIQVSLEAAIKRSCPVPPSSTQLMPGSS